MRRQRRPLVILCLLALVCCQTAMAARWCGGSAAAGDMAVADCHGSPDGEGAGSDGHCLGGDAVPDLVKLPCFFGLPAGHDFLLGVTPHAHVVGALDRFACPRDRPQLDALCRLLI